ncbi:MAG: nuclear transport factor 2 family protein [Bacteroidetes bacterium]|nr:nuclear transport factor 2 family protein [Bacteroidota bacterium]
MKKQLIKVAFLSCVISLTIACSSKKEEASTAPVIDKEQIKKEIQAKEDEFAATYNAAEMKNIGYYADDAISFSQNKAPLVGRQAIVEYLKAGIDSSSKGNKISFVTNEVFPSSDGNQVIEIGYYKLVDSTDVAINTGNYMILFEKRNGSYVSVREMSASDMPLE